ncbi:type IV-A pilus assembly ATPase PilB [Vibrio scophthalmi]|uniref:Type 4 fimbrial assembly protein PilB n=1 Tax=Vibrio scophthalmi TaxID=45658 RepID=A0A1C7F7R8_9VIBR|nr:type IV-A pilus assembly ATPase PilB [Vibrio scophthalmi]ANU35364.1 Type 4 fimbrial assembly protein PilB [Vibrio scophthalmi]
MSHHLATLLSQQGLLAHTQVGQPPFTSNHPSGFDPSILEFISADKLAAVVSQLFKLPQVNIAHYEYRTVCEELGLSTLIQKHLSLPLAKTNGTLTLAVVDPTLDVIEDEFRFATGLQIELVVTDYNAIKKAIYALYGRSLQSTTTAKKEINALELAQLVNVSEEEFGREEDLSLDDAPVSRYIHQILLEAIRKGASDIHFEPYEKHYRIRLRCDGLLVESHQPASQLGRRLSTRLKILANLDIAERRRPQDGRSKVKLNADSAVDMRISTLPTLWGEKVVLRLLESGINLLDIDRLGYSHQQKQHYLKALKQPQGLILFTGPTGSGKTISLYSGLNLLNTTQVNIATAEDPVEINLSGINQVQIQPQIGFDFACALRSFLRQDPDIVMVGEIRDVETADIAIKASQTGHLVLSTLHTNSAADTIVRLASMGIKTYDLAASLTLVMAQRLVRKLCAHCKEPAKRNIDAKDDLLGPVTDQQYQANQHGCTQCNQGYQGRIGLFEVLPINAKLQQAILQCATAIEIETLAKNEGMMSLQQSGIAALNAGKTSRQELQRVLLFG